MRPACVIRLSYVISYCTSIRMMMKAAKASVSPATFMAMDRGKRRRMLVKFLYKAFIGLSCLKGRR